MFISEALVGLFGAGGRPVCTAGPSPELRGACCVRQPRAQPVAMHTAPQELRNQELCSGGTAVTARRRRRRGAVEQGRPYLGPDAEVRVGDELGPLALVLRLQVAVQHAHGHAGQGHDEGQRPPQPGCGHRTAQARGHRAPRPRAAPPPPPSPPRHRPVTSPGLVGRRRRQAASRHGAQGGAQQPRALPQRRHLPPPPPEPEAGPGPGAALPPPA